MTDITTRNKYRKVLICIYTNNDRDQFAIGLKEDENFRAMTKPGEFYTDLLMRLMSWKKWMEGN
jgi:hypothetical protein